jgi:hypothetical protein
MQMIYDSLAANELQGTTQADYLVSLEGDLQISDDDERIYHEPSFPVVELARNLLRWLDDPDRGDFEFDSMSFEEVGAVIIRGSNEGWLFSSVFSPDTASTPVAWHETERCIRAFIAQVEADLLQLGIDPGEVIRK